MERADADRDDDMQFNHIVLSAPKGERTPYPAWRHGTTLDLARDL